MFWVAVAIFFLLGFGVTASENVSIGTPGAVHENAPFAIADRDRASCSLFYLFVVTAFVANAIVRDDDSGFAPIVRATPVTKPQIVLGRFLGGLIDRLARLSCGPARHVARLEHAVGRPRNRRPPEAQLLRVELSRCSRFPTSSLTSAVLFALATMLRSMMAAYVGAIVFVMGYMVTSSVLSAEDRYRDTFARWRAARDRRARRSDALLDRRPR